VVSPLCSVCAEPGPQSQQQGQTPPPICMATRNEFLPRNAWATRFGNLDLEPSAYTLASRLLQNSPLKEDLTNQPQQALADLVPSKISTIVLGGTTALHTYRCGGR